MLFNSPEFLLVFLPAALLLVWAALRGSNFLGLLNLIAASLAFYAWWSVDGLALIGVSIAVNFAIAKGLAHLEAHAASRASRLALLWLGVAFNLGALGYFKYTDFLVAIVGSPALKIALPLAISFFSFQQIAFLIDTYRNRMGATRRSGYTAAVVFFPHLIAGPLIRYAEIAAQFRKHFAISTTTIMAGLPIFGSRATSRRQKSRSYSPARG